MAIETTPPQSADWQELVARKRRDRLEKTPREWILSGELLLKVPPQLLEYDLPRRCGLLSESELDISESYTATQLLGQLALGQLSSLEVTTAFCKRAAIAQQVVSCALNRDRKNLCDAEFKMLTYTCCADLLPHGDLLFASPR